MASSYLNTIKSKLDGLIQEAEFFPPSAAQEIQVVLNEAIVNFKAGGPELLDQATEHLWKYYQDEMVNWSPEDCLEEGIPEIAKLEDVWQHIEFSNEPTVSIGVDKYEPAPSYISFEGRVAWEPDHGLQLVFENGSKVCKVGPYNGHHTNARARADTSFLDVIYIVRNRA